MFNSKTRKKGILFLAITLVIAGVCLLSAPKSTQAATIAELQAQIDALLAQLSGVSSGPSTGCYAFTRDLTVGVSGADVSALQSYLAAKGMFSVAPTGYFGPITQSSVAAWQSANGVMPAVGYFGAISRAKYNSTCTVSVPPTTGGGSTGNSSSSGTLKGGEADLNGFDASSGEDSSIEEGDSGEIFEFEFDVDDADVKIERVDVMFSRTSAAGDNEPWEVFDDITLMLDGDEVGSVDGSDEDNWDEDEDDEYRLRFSRINVVVKEGETPEFILNVGTQSNVDDVDAGVEWTVWVPEEGVRALDGEGIDHTIGDDDTLAGATDEVAFDIDLEGEGEELTVRESSKNPDATVLELEDDTKSDWLTVLAFTLEAEDNDIEIREIPIVVNVSSSTYSGLIDSAQLVIGKKTFKVNSVSGGNTAQATTTFTFKRNELVVDEGEKVEVSFELRFKQLEEGNTGTTVVASLTSAGVDEIEAEGADDLNATQLKGSANGDAHTLRTEGIALMAGDKSAKTKIVNGDDNDQATYTIEFEVTAFGEDFYIPFGAVASTSSWTDEGVSFDFLNGSNQIVTVGAASSTASLDSTADEDDGAYVVREGDTETFTLTVDYIPGGSAPVSYKVLLQSVYFRMEGVLDSASTAQNALPESDYRTNATNILN